MLWTWPNFISLFRVVLMFYSFWDYYNHSSEIVFLILTFFVIVLDGLDGIVARKLNQCSPLGAKVDILADRITELAYWLYFGYLGYIGYWVFWFFLIRGILVDYLTRHDDKPLGESFLRSSRFMRFLYGSLKLMSFVMLIILPHYHYSGINITYSLVLATVIVCFLRAYPVLRRA